MPPDAESHSIVVADEYGDIIVMPFFLRGVTSCLNVEPLTPGEWDAHTCPRVILTDLDLTWDPNTDIYEDQENAMVDHQNISIVRNSTARGPLMEINSVCMSTCTHFD